MGTTNTKLTFGYAAQDATEEAIRAMNDLLGVVGTQARVDIAVRGLATYDRVAQAIHKGEIDLAWVSPIPFMALLRSESVVPLACPQRGGTHYHGALVVPADAPVGELSLLVGKSAAWVDRYSAAGFVVPRIQLAKGGLDVKTAFPSERFYGSHAAVVKAVADGAADFGATFVRLAPSGAVVGGPWVGKPEIEDKLRVFAMFGEIPPDVVVARDGLDAAVRDRVRVALLALPKTPRGKKLLETVFGAEGMFVPNTASYETLRQEAAAAVQENLLEIVEEIEPDLPTAPRL
jgi:ABC-type phosphate/phosphonate transport system substrate-binding protein